MRGLKSTGGFQLQTADSRTPHGVRGLKSSIMDAALEIIMVAPRTGCVD